MLFQLIHSFGELLVHVEMDFVGCVYKLLSNTMGAREAFDKCYTTNNVVVSCFNILFILTFYCVNSAEVSCVKTFSV
jgi:hypothetical protein